MYTVEANRYYYSNRYQSYKDAMIEFNKLVKEGRTVKIKKGNKVIKEHKGELDVDIDFFKRQNNE